MPKTPETPQEISDAALQSASGGHSGFATGKRMHKPLTVSVENDTAGGTGFDPASDLKAKGFNPQPEPPAVNMKLKR